eukprot:178471_1
MDIVSFDYDDTIERVMKTHKRKVSRYAALVQELSLYFDEEEAERIAKATLKEFNSNSSSVQQVSVESIIAKVKKEHKRKISQFRAIVSELSQYFPHENAARDLAAEVMNEFNPNDKSGKRCEITRPLMDSTTYIMIVHNVLKNHDSSYYRINAFKSELLIYFSKPVAYMMAIFTIRQCEKCNLLVFGYIAALSKSNNVSNFLPSYLIDIIIAYFSNDCYKYDAAYNWTTTIQDMVIKYIHTGSDSENQFKAIETCVIDIGFEKNDAISVARNIIQAFYLGEDDVEEYLSEQSDNYHDSDTTNPDKQTSNDIDNTFSWWDWNCNDYNDHDIHSDKVKQIIHSHKRKVSQLEALKIYFGQYHFSESESLQKARDTMKAYSPYSSSPTEVINYKCIVDRVLKNNHNIKHQIRALEEELNVYFQPTISTEIAMFAIKVRVYDNLLVFGYIAEMRKINVIKNGIPYDIIELVFQFLSSYCQREASTWKINEIINNVFNKYNTKILQFREMKAQLKPYFMEERCNMLAAETMKALNPIPLNTRELSIEHIVAKVRKEHKRKVSQFEAVKEELNEFHIEDDIHQLAAEIMNEFNPNERSGKGYQIDIDVIVDRAMNEHRRRISQYEAIVEALKTDFLMDEEFSNRIAKEFALKTQNNADTDQLLNMQYFMQIINKHQYMSSVVQELSEKLPFAKQTCYNMVTDIISRNSNINITDDIFGYSTNGNRGSF